MCDEPTKKFIRETVEGNTNRIKYDLLRNIDVVKGIAEAVRDNVIEINGTVKTHGRKISKIEEKARHKEAYCPYSDDIAAFKEHILTKEALKEYLEKKETEDAATALLMVEEANVRNRKIQWVVACIVGAGTIIMGLINWLL